jgi:hypothetical protein
MSDEINAKLAVKVMADSIRIAHNKDLDDAAEYTLALEELIRWLALPYAGNEPIFAHSNWDGSPIESGARLRKTFRHVVGPGPETLGAWARCTTCGIYSVRSELIEA